MPFDQDVPVYGPGAQHPLFEFEESPIYGLAEKIGYYGTAPVRFLGGAGVAAGVAGKGIADLLVNTGGAVAYGMAANVYGPETAAKFFGAQADATAALATGLGRLGIAAATLGYQPLLNVVAPEFAAEQRTLLQNTATAVFDGFTGGGEEFAGLGWEFRAGFTAFNLLGVIQAAGELTQVAKAARLSARAIAAESAGQMGAVRALRINQPTAEAAEAAAALTGAPQTTCRIGRPGPQVGLADGPDGIPVPITELKNQKVPQVAAKELGSRGIRNTEPLTAAQTEQVMQAARELGLDPKDIHISYNPSAYKAFSDFDYIQIGPNAFPSGATGNIWERLSMKSAVAHEGGHLITTRGGIGLAPGSAADEILATIAGRDLPSLSSLERYQLLRYAVELAKESGVDIRQLLAEVAKKTAK